MFREIILAVIVSFDTFLVAAACCNSGIRIPVLPGIIINLTGGAVLSASMFFSGFISRFLPVSLCRTAGTVVLCMIGTVTIFKSLVRILVARLSENGELSLKTGSSGLMVKLYLDDTAADTDHSSSLSSGEAAALALASSLDSAATGMSCAAAGMSPVKAGIFAFFSGFAALMAGSVLGRKISSRQHDLSWLGGVFIILFAVFVQNS